MSGPFFAQAKSAIQHGLSLLHPGDTFQLIHFSRNAARLAPEPLPATEANLRRALRYLARIRHAHDASMIER